MRLTGGGVGGELVLRRGGVLPTALATFGIATGIALALGLAGLPGVIRSVDAWEQFPMPLIAAWTIDWPACLVLQPFWYFQLARWAFKQV